MSRARVFPATSIATSTAIVAVLATVALSITGCSAPEKATLAVGGDGLVACLPAGNPDTGYIALPIENTGPDPIVLSGTNVAPIMGAQLVGSWVLPASDDTAAESGTTGEAYFGPLPPADSEPWAQRERALGAALEPGESATLALEVTNPSGSEQAAIDGATVSYTGSGGGSLLAKAGFFFRFSTIDGECAAPEQ